MRAATTGSIVKRPGRQTRFALGSVDFRLRHRSLSLQEIKVAALVGLADMLGKHRTIAAWIFRRRRFPGGLPPGELGVADVQMDHPFVDVDLDFVAGLDESERSADEALGCDVENARAVARAAHAAVG